MESTNSKSKHSTGLPKTRCTPHKKNCQVRYTGSCACIAELCTEKASSPEHRSLALCAHRYAWLSQLTPRKPCHGMQTGSEASPPMPGPCSTRTSPRYHSMDLRAQGHVCRGEHKIEIVTQRRAAAEDETHPPQKICQARDTGSCACIA